MEGGREEGVNQLSAVRWVRCLLQFPDHRIGAVHSHSEAPRLECNGGIGGGGGGGSNAIVVRGRPLSNLTSLRTGAERFFMSYFLPTLAAWRQVAIC